MKPTICLRPEERFVATRRPADAATPVIRRSVRYRCPVCGAISEVPVTERFEFGVSEDDRAILTRAAIDAGRKNQERCVFMCTGCKRPVCAVFDVREFAMSCYEYEPAFLIEFKEGGLLST